MLLLLHLKQQVRMKVDLDVRITDKEDLSKYKIDDLTGQKIGPYLVKSYAGRGYWNGLKSKYHLWEVSCDCGTDLILKHYFLNPEKEDEVSCICDRFNGLLEKYQSLTKRHKNVINKCYHQDEVTELVWSKFGGRKNPVTQEPEPVLVCDEWHNKYQFAKGIEASIGFPPSKGWILTLIDESKNFSPENIKWVKKLTMPVKEGRLLSVVASLEPSTEEISWKKPSYMHLQDLMDLSKSISDIIDYSLLPETVTLRKLENTENTSDGS